MPSPSCPRAAELAFEPLRRIEPGVALRARRPNPPTRWRRPSRCPRGAHEPPAPSFRSRPTAKGSWHSAPVMPICCSICRRCRRSDSAAVPHAASSRRRPISWTRRIISSGVAERWPSPRRPTSGAFRRMLRAPSYRYRLGADAGGYSPLRQVAARRHRPRGADVRYNSHRPPREPVALALPTAGSSRSHRRFLRELYPSPRYALPAWRRRRD